MQCPTSPSPAPAAAFHEAQAVSAYAARTRRLVPGWDSLQTMVDVLLAERAPASARVLVVGAGGGAELNALAQTHADWRFVGVDPSEPMLDLARTTLGPRVAQVGFHHGYVDTAPAGPFDAATCLLTLHFVDHGERLPTLQHIHRRLRPGAPFALGHLSFPQAPEDKALWMSRYAAFATASGVDAAAAQRAATTISASLPLLGPDDEEALLRQAGFQGTQLFYAGLAFRGWVAYA